MEFSQSGIHPVPGMTTEVAVSENHVMSEDPNIHATQRENDALNAAYINATETTLPNGDTFLRFGDTTEATSPERIQEVMEKVRDKDAEKLGFGTQGEAWAVGELCIKEHYGTRNSRELAWNKQKAINMELLRALLEQEGIDWLKIPRTYGIVISKDESGEAKISTIMDRVNGINTKRFMRRVDLQAMKHISMFAVMRARKKAFKIVRHLVEDKIHSNGGKYVEIDDDLANTMVEFKPNSTKHFTLWVIDQR